MSEVTDIVEAVEKTEQFSAFRTTHPRRFLVHIFCLIRSGTPARDVGYYDADEDTITTFSLDPVGVRDPEPVFKESGTLEALDLARVTLDLSQARAQASEALRATQQGHEPAQEICILQQYGVPTWNITIITNLFAMFNIKIDASSGDVISSDMRSLLELRSTK